MATGNSSGLLPIVVGVNGDSWRLFSARKLDSAFRPFFQAVLKRDDYSCRYCGFCSKLHQEVINIDGNFLNNRVSNLATACCFCCQCFFLDAVGGDISGGGQLIYLPEMSQGQLNALAHVLFSVMHRHSNYLNSAQNTYQRLTARGSYLVKILGMDAISDVTAAGRYFLNLEESSRFRLEDELFTRVRLLPSYAGFAQAIDDWDQESRKLMKEF